MAQRGNLIDEQQITRVMDEWRRRTADGDVNGLLALMTDDAVFLTPGHAPISKADFVAGFQQVSAKVRIESTQDVREIRASGDVAYAWSHISVAMIPKEEGGRRWKNSGHVLTVFRKSPAGKWLLARDANLMTGAGNPDRV